VTFHHLLTGGMEFAYELVEGEAVHRPATLFLHRNELLEDFTEVGLFALYCGGRRL